jgi:hypothetical protein
MAQSKRKFYKSTVLVTILSETEGVAGIYADMINQHCNQGDDCLGISDQDDEKVLTAKQAVSELEEMACEGSFFMLTDTGEDDDF